jgi:hypothetical protein
MCYNRLRSIYLHLLMPVACLAALSGTCPLAYSAPDKIIERGIVVLVQFPDVRHDLSREQVQMRFSRQLNAYVNDMSYGKVGLEIDVTRKWYTMPRPIGQYRISSRNLQVDTTRVRRLIDDALAAADAEVDFSNSSFVVLFMAAQVDEYGMVGLCGYPGMLGWGRQGALRSPAGEPVKGVAIFCYQAHLGTLFHDVAHVLGGVKDGKRMVPCLYDHDLQAKPGDQRQTFVDSTVNMGFWDPMSCHFYNRQQGPPGISSWTKLRLNWIDQGKIKTVRPGEIADVFLGPLEEASSEILAVKIPLSPDTYYLVENRQPLGFDRNLPASGLLIMYADDSIPECRQGRAPVKLVDADPSVAHLEGAAFDIGRRNSFTDEKNRVKIEIKEKVGLSYRLVIAHQ